MTPLFKSQYSIGKSILTVGDIVDIAKYNSLKEVVCVEDSFYGFRSLKKELKENKIKFVFGLRLPVVQNHNDSDLRPSKLIFFAKFHRKWDRITPTRRVSKSICRVTSRKSETSDLSGPLHRSNCLTIQINYHPWA